MYVYHIWVCVYIYIYMYIHVHMCVIHIYAYNHTPKAIQGSELLSKLEARKRLIAIVVSTLT